ncbi:hypothetical protein HMPREF9714_01432 [Myroides odoratimimus CCUG 12901]|uniref:alpha/beta hydrolase family protein n=1 Tax=Myroides odoratimimus TaxID=76832 RepID=UPI000246094A|nr:prolyl oligopeptidase family serine peptidase [Myroides odoratimimus]EHO11003.1 hypothetical protein HMPREF9714_01432 [Myroides odoratimimus CCUG 12901]
MNTNIKIILTIFFLLFNTLLATSQTITDSLKYSELNNSTLTKNGKLSIVHKNYKFDSKKDSVFIFNNGKLILSKQTNSLHKEFKDNLLTSYNTDKKELEILNGTTLEVKIIPNVTKPIIIKKHGLVFFLDSLSNTYKLVKIYESDFKTIWENPKSLTNFTSVSDNKEVLLIQYQDTSKGVELIEFSNFKKTLNKKITYAIKQVRWSKKYPIVFILPTSINTNKYPFLIFYNYKKNITLTQKLNQEATVNKLEAIGENCFKVIQNSPLEKKPYNTNEVELWSTQDRYLRNILSESNIDNRRSIEHIIVDYNKHKIFQPQILNNHESVSLNENTLLVFDSNQYLDYRYQWSSRPRDICLYDIKNNAVTTITKQQESPFNTTSLSPKGNYFLYVKNNTMHFYNINSRRVDNTYVLKSDNLKLRIFYNNIRVWSNNERYFYFVSASNLMQYDTKNKSFKVIIDSHNTNSRYEILNSSFAENISTTSELHYQTLKNNNHTLLVHKLNINDNTQSLLIIENGKQKILIKDTQDHISDIKYSDDIKTITYSLENFNKPKTVYIYQQGNTKLLLENSMPKSLYNWKKQKIVSYKDKYGNNLKGVLFYPKEFDINRKYPMITHIYEIQNHLKAIFNYPTYLNSDGFNTTILQENNYFVFFPDIIDTTQGTGLSALHCVEEGIKTVLKEEKTIDKENLGLFGFSHGGYKANFILTQSNIFKAVVSGAGNSDIIRSYFSYNENFISPFFFQFENGQYKMPKPFSEDKELYLLNSPILFTDQIKTPILTFTGKLDENIHWEQQREFFIALLRYNVPHVALFYKNEGHGLTKKENQIDITKRLMNWFDYYLNKKYTKETQWIKDYTSFENNRMIKK